MDTSIFAKRRSLLYVFTPQIEEWRHGHLDRVVPQGQRLVLDNVVAIALKAAPDGARLRYVVTPETDDQSVRVYFSASSSSSRPMSSSTSSDEHAEHQRASRPEGWAMDARLPNGTIIYLDPYRGTVLGSHGEMDRFSTWAKRLHSSLLQGNNWRWLLELSTSWMLVMLVTGIYLWWPRGKRSAVPRAGLVGREGWRQWHAFVGASLSVLTLVMLATGLTWSRYSGAQIKATAAMLGQVGPEAPRGLRSAVVPGVPPLTWQAAWNATQTIAPSISYQITPPARGDEPWRITNFDRSQPFKRFDLRLDAFSGRPLYYSGWESMTLFNKATAIGIPFHRGEFGWWNQALLLIFGFGVLWALLSGWMMYFKRMRKAPMGLPRLLPGTWRHVPVWGWLLLAALLVLMPVWTLSVVVVALAEGWMQRRALTAHAKPLDPAP
jgi:uncharacterized iron-regulated membrane protein